MSVNPHHNYGGDWLTRCGRSKWYCRSTCAYVYEYVPVGQNTWQSKHCVSQHYIGQSTPHRKITKSGHPVWLRSSKVRQKHEETLDDRSVFKKILINLKKLDHLQIIHIYVYEYVPVSQNTWQSKHCVSQHYIGQSTPHRKITQSGHPVWLRPSKVRQKHEETLDDWSVFKKFGLISKNLIIHK
jgi:hypothetical protein